MPQTVDSAGAFLFPTPYGRKGLDMPEETEQTVDSAAQTETVDSAQATDAAANAQQAPRSYSQAEMDAVIKKRIDKQSEKHAQEVSELTARIKSLEEARSTAEADLTAIKQEKQMAEIVANVARATGLPYDTVADLRGDTEEELLARAERIASLIPKYPEVRDGGGAKKPETSKEHFVRELFQASN